VNSRKLPFTRLLAAVTALALVAPSAQHGFALGRAEECGNGFESHWEWPDCPGNYTVTELHTQCWHTATEYTQENCTVCFSGCAFQGGPPETQWQVECYATHAEYCDPI
jgi:hypothetical protein